MEVGIGLSGGFLPSQIPAFARAVETAGLSALWVTEGNGGDAFSLLAGCAATTRRIALGTAVVNIFSRSATLIAMSAATLDELSSGRFRLGLGVSHVEQVVGEHGLRFEKPMRRMEDTVEVVRRLIRAGRIGEVDLPTIRLEGFELGFQPLRQSPPVYVAAVGPRMLDLCSRVADGAVLIWRCSDEIPSLKLAAGASRLACLIHCGLGRTPRDCQRSLESTRGRYRRFARYRWLFDQQVVPAGVACSSAAALQEALEAYAAAGLDEAILVPTPADDVPSEEAALELVEMATAAGHM